MKYFAFKFSVVSLVLAVFSFGMAGCGGGTSSVSKNSGPPPKLGSMAGAWDFTASGGGGGNPVAVEAILTQDASGNISGSGTATANGPSGGIFEADVFGASLSAADDMAVDYLGDTCSTDNGNRSITGTIDSSNKVTLAFSTGGGFTVNITGTLNASANPPFSGTFTVAAPGCKSNGQAGNITGALASSLTGSYSGTSAADNTEAITLTITDTSGSLSANGTDSKTGNFTATGTAVGNAFSTTITPTPGIGGSIYGYYDPQLGAKGSILLVSFQGGNAASCPNGVPIDNGSCLIAILAMQ